MTTKDQILRRLAKMEEKIDTCNQVLIFDSEEEYQAYRGPAPAVALIDNIPRREKMIN